MSFAWKQRLARALENPFAQWLKRWGIEAVVPRHRVGVAVLAGDGHGRVLMLRHVFHAQFPWGLPGGWLSANEDPAAGALRELREETGLTAVLHEPLLVWSDTGPTHLGIVFRASLQPQPVTLSSEILEARWFAAHEIPQNSTPYAQQAIAAAYGPASQPQIAL